MYKRLQNSARQIAYRLFFVFLESNGLYKIDGTKVIILMIVIIRKSKTLSLY